MYNFAGKVALITGGTEGIGLAAALRFAQCGAKVFVVGRSTEKGAAALVQLHKITADAAFFSADMGATDAPAQIANMIAECVAKFGVLDFAINNAAASFPLLPTADIPLASVDLSIATDLRGTWLCMKHEIDAMLKTGGGAIVNVSSVNGFLAAQNGAIYSATKHGMNGLTAAAAREYIGQGIRINTVCPGAIETPRRQARLVGKTADEIAANYADLAQRIPAGRVGTAAEVAAAILWLCSAESSYVVGQDIVVDGGFTA